MKVKFSARIWILIIVVLLCLLAIFGNPIPKDGVVVKSVDKDSQAFDEGLRQGNIITKIDGIPIENLASFTEVVTSKFPSSESIKTVITIDDGTEFTLFSNSSPQITVANIPKTNLQLGLDLSGGARALVQAEDKALTSAEVNDLVDTTSNRLNQFGISDVKVAPVSDLSGNNYMLIEIAGATPTDLKELISEQGKFEAKIGNETVFAGGSKDIASVSRNAQESGIRGCQSDNGQWFCTFSFTIYLSQEAAQRHANITAGLDVDPTNPQYLTLPLDLYLDDSLVDSLRIGTSLQGVVTTQVAISGSGTGATQEEAFLSAESQMKKLQTLLITGSLPFKLEIVKLDSISPTLGQGFSKSILLAGVVALFAVSILIFIRYKSIKPCLALLLTSISEVVIILGIASIIQWNLDLPSIAGILATIGTGIDQQIIIMDEAKEEKSVNIKQRLKRAFAIILGAYFTALVALLPLLWAGAGLLKGFAVTTLIGITAGVLITRPAFTDIIKKIQKD